MANRLNVIQIVAIHAALNMDGAAIKTDIANAKIASTTLPSVTTVTKETFIVRKVFILKNSALYPLKAHDLFFFNVKFHSSGSNGLATTPI